MPTFILIFKILTKRLRGELTSALYHFNLVFFISAKLLYTTGLAVTVIRLHDIGKSGWMFLIVFIPIIGSIWLLVLECSDGVTGEDKYGPNPKENQEEPPIVVVQ